MNGNETCVIALHYATHVKKNKKKKKEMGFFYPLLNHRLTPISGHKSGGEKCKCEGPLVAPKVTVHSATVNNSKKVASAKVNIFYSDIPVPGGVPGCPRTEGPSDTRALLGGQPRPRMGGAPPPALQRVQIHPL